MTKSAVYFKKIKTQHGKVLKELRAYKSASKRSDKEAAKLQALIQAMPEKDRDLYEESINNYLELLATKFPFL